MGRKPRHERKETRKTYRWSDEDLAILEDLADRLKMTHTGVLRHALRALHRQLRQRDDNEPA